MPFTAAEWEEMRRADEEIEREFRLSPEDLERDRWLTRVARMERMDPARRQPRGEAAGILRGQPRQHRGEAAVDPGCP